MVVPRFIGRALKHGPVTVYGTGKTTHCFTHVKDVVKALIRVVEEPKAVGGVYNIGNQDEITIEDLATKIIKITKSRSTIKTHS